MSEFDKLKHLFDFTDVDLAAIRAGRLSERQQAIYQQRLARERAERLVYRLTWSMFLITLALYMVVSVRFGEQLGPLVLVGLGIWLGLVYGLSKLFARIPRMFPELGRVQTGQQITLQQITGRLTFQSDGEHEQVMIDDIEFAIDVSVEADKRLWKLEANRVYTIYYVKNPLWIAAVEADSENSSDSSDSDSAFSNFPNR